MLALSMVHVGINIKELPHFTTVDKKLWEKWEWNVNTDGSFWKIVVICITSIRNIIYQRKRVCQEHYLSCSLCHSRYYSR